MVARLGLPAFGVGDERRQQPHQRPPFLDGAAKRVHCVLWRKLGVGHRRARTAENVGGDRAHGRADRRVGLQGGFLTHFYQAVHVLDRRA